VQTLLVRRDRSARFMAGARVFPGGSVDDADRGAGAARVVLWSGDAEELPWRAAALRELSEEAGITITRPEMEGPVPEGEGLFFALAARGAMLDADRLHYLSNWITPAGLPKRFDTRFFVAAVAAGAAARTDDVEVFEPEWVRPSVALDRAAAGAWLIELPTRVHLELLADLGDVDAILSHAEAADPKPVEPVLVSDPDGTIRVVVPGSTSRSETVVGR
jgi:8-oxo-dGTP pyrophosphatase MutT (NUDIX family)